MTGESPRKLIKMLDQFDRQMTPPQKRDKFNRVVGKQKSARRYRSRIDEYASAHIYESQRKAGGRIGRNTVRHTTKTGIYGGMRSRFSPTTRGRGLQQAKRQRNEYNRVKNRGRNARSPSPPPLIISSNTTLIHSLQEVIESKRVFDNLTPKALQNLFISIDRDGFGRVDAEDVQFILRKVGVGVTPLQAEDIVNSLSSEQNQLVYYDDLIMVLFNRTNLNDNPLLESYTGRGSPDGNSVQRMPMRPLATSIDPHSKSRIVRKTAPRPNE